MSSLTELIGRCETVLTEGSVFELLRRDPSIAFDPHIAHAGLIYDDLARARLAAVHASYLAIARQERLPILAFADTWRASGERIAASAFPGRSVNRDNVAFLRGVASASGASAFVGALTGPRGDAYRPAEAPSASEAMKVHAFQIAELAGAGADLIMAATLPAFDEARGIAMLLSRTAVPWVLSFVVRPAGTLLDGTPLDDAIRAIDASVARLPLGYAINCVHPDVGRQALSRVHPDARSRVIAFQGNTSGRTPEELDNLPHVESTDPEGFAGSVLALMRDSSLCVIGGCCGTDERHLAAVARRLSASR